MKRLFAIAMLGVVARSAFANGEMQDSVRVHHIQEVVVTSRLISRETIPSQTLGGEELKKLNSLSVADALRYFSGLQLKEFNFLSSSPPNVCEGIVSLDINREVSSMTASNWAMHRMGR